MKPETKVIHKKRPQRLANAAPTLRGWSHYRYASASENDIRNQFTNQGYIFWPARKIPPPPLKFLPVFKDFLAVI